MNSLSELQSWMSWIITDPRGVESALQGLRPEVARQVERLPRKLDEISALNEEDRIFRLSVYAEGYFSRLLEVISADYPLTLKAMGEDQFMECIAAYLRAHPSRTPNAGEVGEALPDFLSRDYVSRVEPHIPPLAFLELAMVHAFYAPDDEGAKQIEMNSLGDALFEATAVFPRSLQFVLTDWNFEDEDTPKREDSLYVVYRDEEYNLQKICLSSWKKKILLQLKEALTLGALFEEVFVDEASTQIQEKDVQEFFSFLISKGVIWDFYGKK